MSWLADQLVALAWNWPLQATVLGVAITAAHIHQRRRDNNMGLLGDIFGQAAGKGSTDSGGGVDRSDKEQTRKHYEKQEKKQTPEEQERAKPKDEPRDGKVW